MPNQQRTICVGDLDSWEDILEYWNSSKYPYIKWTDVKVDEINFVRNVGNIIYHIDNGEIAYCEKKKYNFSDMVPLSFEWFQYQDKNKNGKIGVIDLETYGSKRI